MLLVVAGSLDAFLHVVQQRGSMCLPMAHMTIAKTLKVCNII